MRKLYLAICLGSISLAAGARTDDASIGTLPAPPAEKRIVRVQSAPPVYGSSGYNVYVDPSAASAGARRRCRQNLFRTPPYEPDYGATHGWGFPGGRWDPSLPRD